jgi:hypothetical protein
MKPTTFLLGLLLLVGGLWAGWAEGKRATDFWYWSRAKEFVGYGYVGAVPNDGRIYCSDIRGSIRVAWSERGSVCHVYPSERIDPEN